MTEPTQATPRPDDLLPAGSQLGPYEIEGLLGSGGMGRVYRAHDRRLGRRVAIKTLSASAAGHGSDGLRRFETEARAAGSLDHPNLLVVYDIGHDRGIAYLVAELLEGETLRARLGREGALPEAQAIDYALQAARGLAAAHARGIVHRDLKPENLFITRERGLKILDFGIAKLLPGSDVQHGDGEAQAMTVAGMMVGTIGYMAPEQLNGQPVDHRTDLFSLGVVLHEMLSGKAPFLRATPVASMHAIASEEAPALPASVSPAVAAVVERCLGKAREDRYASTNELIGALELLATTTRGASTRAPARAGRGITRRESLRLASIGAASAIAGLGGGAALQHLLQADPLPPSFRRLTFRRGLVRSARFAPDGETILYGALWDGEPCRVHAVRLDGPESRALDLPPANLLGVSRSGELALATGAHHAGIVTYGTLARVPMTGGVPRELIEAVKFADWSPSGAELAVVRRLDGRDVLDYPGGRTLVDPAAGEGSGLGFARVSPDGRRVAYAQYRSPGSLFGRVCVVDEQGRASALTDDYLNLHGLAWKGEEIWYTAADQQPLFRALCAVRPGQPPRTIFRVPGNVTLWDIAPGGRMVLAHTDDRGALFVQRGDEAARDLSWLDASSLADLSRDGSLVLFTEDGQGGGAESSVYLRRTDGSEALRLGPGRALALSPDARWVLCIALHEGLRRLQLVPTGAGENRIVPDHGLTVLEARWLPDGRRFVAEALSPGEPARLVCFDLDAAAPRALAPAGVRSWALAPDGVRVAVRGADALIRLHAIDGEEARELPGDASAEAIIGWIDAGLLVMRPGDAGTAPGDVFLVDLDSGERRRHGNLLPRDGAGIMALVAYRVTPDGATQAYAWHRALSNLYVVEGFD